MNNSPALLARRILGVVLLMLLPHGIWALAQEESPPPRPTTPVAELNPSILLFHASEHPDGVRLVRRAARLGCRRVNVVVTMLCKINKTRHVTSFGLWQKNKYVALNEKLLSEFRAALEATFAEAAAHDMDLAVLVHLDSWGKIDDWRNHFRFDPLVRHGKFSYQEALITPIADALAATVTPSTRVDFSIAGEMGRSVFAHADSYAQLANQLHRDRRLPNLQVGVSLNFSSVAGGRQPTAAEREQMQRLVDRCDFVGLSDYRPFELPPDPNDFARTVDAFVQEMAHHGAHLPDALPLHFSEVGLGGGKENGVPARTPAEAAQTPWKGCNDPRQNPWRRRNMRQLRIDFYRALLEFLAHQGSAHRVTQAFLWSEGSWDPQGILDPAFADPEIIRLIRLHNEVPSAR